MDQCVSSSPLQARESCVGPRVCFVVAWHAWWEERHCPHPRAIVFIDFQVIETNVMAEKYCPSKVLTASPQIPLFLFELQVSPQAAAMNEQAMNFRSQHSSEEQIAHLCWASTPHIRNCLSYTAASRADNILATCRFCRLLQRCVPVQSNKG